ncbi:MAG: coproporphyrinogen III oxidase family protein, partial [Pseudopedobacter sp.]|nr:coproporphyrinogen III oxidase family protein [Deinococcales bacterium]
PSPPEPQSSADVLALRYTQPHLYSWLEGESPELEQISPEEYVTDALFMGLRLTDGVDLVGLGARAGVDILERFGAVIWEQVEKRLLVLEGNQLKTTETGRWVLNKVVAAFLEG